MAGPDLSIYRQFMQPVRSVADFTQEADAAESNKLQLLLQQGKLTDEQTAREEQRRLMSVMRGLDPDMQASDRSQALRRAGFFGQADALDKSSLDRRKVETDIGKTESETQIKKLEAYGKAGEVHRDALRFVNDPQSAAQWLAAGYNDPIVGEIVRRTGPLENALQKIPQDPAKFREWKLQAEAGIAKFIEATKPVLGNRNLGGTYQNTATDPLTGKVTVTDTAAITQDANSIASNARMAADAAAGRSVTMRGQNMTDARSRETTDLKRQELQMSTESGLPVLGVPKPAVLPWSNQSNPKDANKVKAAEFSRGSKDVEKDADAARAIEDAATQAKQFLKLNEKVKTGGMLDKFGPTQWAQSLGDDYATMQAITAKLAPSNRPVGAGATSDFDAKQYERASPGVDKPAKTNSNIARSIIARAEQSRDYADFRQTYLEQNGTLSGADRSWKQYVDKNPIFDPSKEGTFDLNPSRKPWREHFAGKASSAAGSGRSVIDAADAILSGGANGNR